MHCSFHMLLKDETHAALFMLINSCCEISQRQPTPTVSGTHSFRETDRRQNRAADGGRVNWRTRGRVPGHACPQVVGFRAGQQDSALNGSVY